MQSYGACLLCAILCSQQPVVELNVWFASSELKATGCVDPGLIALAKDRAYVLRFREFSAAEFDAAVQQCRNRKGDLPDIVAGFRRPSEFPEGFIRCFGVLTGISADRATPLVGIIRGSKNHEAAVALAMARSGERLPYPDAWSYKKPDYPIVGYFANRKERLVLQQLLRRAVKARVSGDEKTLAQLAHKDALPMKKQENGDTEVSNYDGYYIYGNKRLVFTYGLVGFQYETSFHDRPRIGCTPVVSVWRRDQKTWRLMLITTDAVTAFTARKKLAELSRTLGDDWGQMPIAPKLVQPPNGQAVKDPPGGFGDYTWRLEDKPLLEVAEFNYRTGTRLFVNAKQKASSGDLFRSATPWSWRVWSVSRSGHVAFSDVRSFPAR